MESIYDDDNVFIEYLTPGQAYGQTWGPEQCLVDLLEWPSEIAIEPRAGHALTPLITTSVKALLARRKPRLRIIFAPLDLPSRQNAAGLLELFRLYSIPSDFVSQRLRAVTHSFYADPNRSLHRSWFHFLCKNVAITQTPGQVPRVQDPRGTELSQADWTWLRSSFYLSWTNRGSFDQSTVSLIVFSASPELIERFQRLWDHNLAEVLLDPFSFYVIILDELWAQADGVMKAVGIVFGPMERDVFDSARAADLRNDQLDFVGLHNMAKHMIYLREGADAALSTAKHLLEHHQELVNESSQDQAVKANMKLVHQMLRQKLVQFEVWRLRVTSLEQRMQNVINLSFNIVTQRDSQYMKNDSKSMRVIASVTVAFLPLATVAAIFGSQFFNFNSTSRTISVAKNFWIFWVLTAPLSALIFILYYWLCYFRKNEGDRFRYRAGLSTSVKDAQ